MHCKRCQGNLRSARPSPYTRCWHAGLPSPCPAHSWPARLPPPPPTPTPFPAHVPTNCGLAVGHKLVAAEAGQAVGLAHAAVPNENHLRRPWGARSNESNRHSACRRDRAPLTRGRGGWCGHWTVEMQGAAVPPPLLPPRLLYFPCELASNENSALLTFISTSKSSGLRCPGGPAAIAAWRASLQPGPGSEPLQSKNQSYFDHHNCFRTTPQSLYSGRVGVDSHFWHCQQRQPTSGMSDGSRERRRHLHRCSIGCL